MSNDYDWSYRKSQYQKGFDFDAIREKRRLLILGDRKVARGKHINRLRRRQELWGVVTDVEGPPAGPWYLKFDCAPSAWFFRVWAELGNVDFDLTGLPEAEVMLPLSGHAILWQFLGGQTFDTALAGVPSALRWRLGAVRRWYTERCSDGDLGWPRPEASLYEIERTQQQLGGRTGMQMLGEWCRLVIAPPLDDSNWDSGDGWWVEVSDRDLTPQAMELVLGGLVSSPTQHIVRALNFPFPEGEEIELDVDIDVEEEEHL